MKVVVDTNIVFSGILNSNGKIGELLLNSKNHFQFFSVDYLKKELQNHQDKILRITGYDEEELVEVKDIIVSKIKFIRDSLIPKEDLLLAEEFLLDIDPDDITFLGLSIHLGATLWTGDKALMGGLKNKGFLDVITTKELFEIYISS